MKSDKTKMIVENAYELMESEEREQGFQRFEFVAEVLIYANAGKIDADRGKQRRRTMRGLSSASGQRPR